jgi:hypothetical protein
VSRLIRQLAGLTHARPLLWLTLAYTFASLTHFVHNAEYIAFYPGLPAWMTRETVYLAWLGVGAVGLLSGLLFKLGWRRSALAVLGIYGALGLDGLLHYTLALCAEHTLMTNITIWSEVTTGLILLLCSGALLYRNATGRQT